ncbi:antiviral reverse transcriptase Drt3a [Pseudooceanicola atlanticus]|nr:antiviral reverse transcriptase Drt3a [Pseudooceanicola atlanticus]
MSQQAYSAESFLEVNDLDNRNGVNKDKDFFPNVHRANLRIDRKARAIRNFYKKHSSQSSKLTAARKEQARNLFKNLKTEKKRKRELLTHELQRISEIISSKSFSVSLHSGFANGKPTYAYGETPDEYYALKQTAINIRRIYRVKQSSGSAICSQILNMAMDGYKYHIVRADIKTFYESAPQEKLIEKLEFDSLLSIKSRRILKQVLETYATANGGTDKGIPRGVNVSADLAELYMRDLDEKIKQLEGVCFYARYVDDIIVFFAQPKHLDSQPRLPSVSQVIISFGLEVNEGKTYEVSLSKRPNLE